jgi:hypothetical protein
MCCIDGFNQSGITGNWYQDGGESGDVIDIDPDEGFFVAAVVALSDLPLPGISGEAIIASNGGLADEGWELYLANGPVDFFGNPTVLFGFRVYGGAGVVADRVASIGAIGFEPSLVLEPQLGITQVFFRIFAWFEAVGATPFGSINIAVEGDAGGIFNTSLSAAYVNSSPRFKLGVGQGVSPLLSTNCLQGVVLGNGVPSGTAVEAMNTVLSGADNAPVTEPGWLQEVGPLSQLPVTSPGRFDDAAQYQIVAPNGRTFVPTLTAVNGWRANNPALPVGDAPDPLLPFLGSVSLVPAFPLVFPRNSLDIECSQPSVFWSQTSNYR